ncbi:MAG TPA: endonuclease III domain-containing protein [Terriglobia bacterium]|nr:endonuclease III domain-containing protein [Terriglobia bacterium]
MTTPRCSPGDPVSFRRREVIAGENGDLHRYYLCLLEALGPQGWWPAETRLEVILGAILTQNTTWRNAASAIARLRETGALDLERLRTIGPGRLQSLIRPAGFFRRKSRAIRGFLRWLDETHQGSLDRMFARPAEHLRADMLRIKGLGPETVDAILLYAGGKPFFVADAYTRRVLGRHGILTHDAGYGEAQRTIHQRLERDAGIYSEFHALLVEVGKHYCRSQEARCGGCPLEIFLPDGKPPEQTQRES